MLHFRRSVHHLRNSPMIVDWSSILLNPKRRNQRRRNENSRDGNALRSDDWRVSRNSSNCWKNFSRRVHLLDHLSTFLSSNYLSILAGVTRQSNNWFSNLNEGKFKRKIEVELFLFVSLYRSGGGGSSRSTKTKFVPDERKRRKCRRISLVDMDIYHLMTSKYSSKRVLSSS